jgi:hypothetical protein
VIASTRGCSANGGSRHSSGYGSCGGVIAAIVSISAVIARCVGPTAVPVGRIGISVIGISVIRIDAPVIPTIAIRIGGVGIGVGIGIGAIIAAVISGVQTDSEIAPAVMAPSAVPVAAPAASVPAASVPASVPASTSAAVPTAACEGHVRSTQ